jgi:hypothetical protein
LPWRRHACPFISLSDASSSQIEWLSRGGMRVKLGSNTAAHAGNDNVFELRAKFPDGSFVTVQKGNLHVIESTVDTRDGFCLRTPGQNSEAGV